MNFEEINLHKHSCHSPARVLRFNTCRGKSAGENPKQLQYEMFMNSLKEKIICAATGTPPAAVLLKDKETSCLYL
jgi:hypothetical protein